MSVGYLPPTARYATTNRTKQISSPGQKANAPAAGRGGSMHRLSGAAAVHRLKLRINGCNFSSRSLLLLLQKLSRHRPVENRARKLDSGPGLVYDAGGSLMVEGRYRVSLCDQRVLPSFFISEGQEYHQPSMREARADGSVWAAERPLARYILHTNVIILIKASIEVPFWKYP